ncbi:YhgE/Pip domain-containing protein [Schaalia sp. ZJ1691]|uniref:YhgE/Pip domain-containing protein n=1 Tax=Schaalia sp. ZJ1691 TaxID=2709404 RepID=UPI0013EBD295|nr:YhgE/Pip domain-containing protein [Schaalia sp. ZJ1691]
MKTLWALCVSDIRRMTMNTVSVIIVIGLVVIPGIFTWFNVIANWDPFARTGNLKFAVANDDVGYRSDLVPITVNIGDQVINTLRANSQLDWAFTTTEEAIEGTKSGKYYAAVVIPEQFSEDMLTFFTRSTQATLTYYNNEKKNALTPKITGQGADTVSAEINQVFSQTLAETALDIGSQLAASIDTPETQQRLLAFDAKLTDFADSLGNSATLLDSYAVILDSSGTLMDSSAKLLASTRSTASDARDTLANAAAGVSDVSSAISLSSTALSTALDQAANGYSSVATKVDDLVGGASATATDTARTLRDLSVTINTQATHIDQLTDHLTSVRDSLSASDPTGAHPAIANAVRSLNHLINSTNAAHSSLDALKSKLSDQADSIDAKVEVSDSDRKDIADLATQAKNAIEAIRSDFSSTVSPALDSVRSNTGSAASALSEAAGDLRSAFSTVTSNGTSGAKQLDDIESALHEAAKNLRDTGDNLNTFHSRLSEALSSGDVDMLRDILGRDSAVFAATLAAPVTVTAHRVFAVDHFGSQMAPFYTFVPLWVGALLLVATLKTSVSRTRRAELGDPPAHILFLGHYGIFGLISLLQATFSLGGSLLFLEVDAVHPWLFMLSGWVSALVYSFFLYTVTVSFGNIGKAIGVIMLVIQITGSGGSYPLVMLPKPIQAISPFLPMTHSIDAIRAAIAGIYHADFWWSIGGLLAFIPPLLLLGLVLRRPLMRFNRWYVDKVEETRIIS